MDRSSFSALTRNTRPKSDIYSTFVIHDDDDDDSETNRRRKAVSAEAQEDPYGTMVFKDNGHDDDDEDEDSSLPPLLKRLPKDFGGGASMDYDDDEESGDFGTVIVKSDRSRQRDRSSSGLTSPAGSTWKTRSSFQANPLNGGDDDEDEDDDGGGFSTFVVRSTVRSGERESVSGTMVRRTGGGSEGGGSTMERAIASMQGVGEFGIGKQRKGSGSSQNEDVKGQSRPTKVSTSSIPDSVIREDPTTKYELLNELGRCLKINQFELVSYIFSNFCFDLHAFLMDFVFEFVVGKGSYGAVYKARDFRTSEMVAIKVISLSEGVSFCFFLYFRYLHSGHLINWTVFELFE